jgi:hypothetical protein
MKPDALLNGRELRSPYGLPPFPAVEVKAALARLSNLSPGGSKLGCRRGSILGCHFDTRHSGNKIAGVAPPYTFKKVQKGRTYYFVVTSVTDADESGESNEIVFKADK